MRSLRGKSVLVMGLGINGGGAGTAAYCARHGAVVTVTDLKPKRALAPSLKKLQRYASIRYILGRHRVADFKTADIIFQNPAVPANSRYLKAARRAGAVITNEAAYFLEKCPALVVGITGTRGKSSVSALTFAMLRTSFATVYLSGNIARESLLTVLDKTRPGDIVVAELSSWHLEHLPRVGVSPDIAVVTNIYPDHLNRYSRMQSYVGAKTNILRYQSSGDLAVLNYDDRTVRNLRSAVQGRLLFFSQRFQTQGCYIREDRIFARTMKNSRFLIKVPRAYSSPHQRSNLLAATTVAVSLGVSASSIRSAAKKFRGLPFRLQYKGTLNTVRLYNDACSSAPIATLTAIQAIDSTITLICGGVDKGLSYRELARTISSSVQCTVLLPGTASLKIKRELKRLGYANLREAATLRRALAVAIDCSGKSSSILFSPGAASFNMFANEFDRGRQFDAEIAYAKKKN